VKQPPTPILKALLGEYDRLKVFLARNRRMEHLDADDLVQNVFLRVLANKDLATVEDPKRFLLYLARFVANSEIPVRDRARITASLDDEMSPCLKTDDDGIDSPPYRAELAELENIVDELEPDLTLVVRLRFFEDLTITQISQRTGKTRDAVKWLLDRAMVMLRNRYDASILKAPVKHQQQRNAS